MSDSHRGGFLSGLFWGGALGGMLGILFAPAKGKETRSKLEYWMGKYKGDIIKALDEIEETGRKLMHETREFVEEGLNKLTQGIEEKEE